MYGAHYVASAAGNFYFIVKTRFRRVDGGRARETPPSVALKNAFDLIILTIKRGASFVFRVFPTLKFQKALKNPAEEAE